MKKSIKSIVWVLTFIVTLIVLFHVEENWRGARAWRKTTAELQAKGYPLTLSEIIPPPVADDDNIAAAPVFAELFIADGEENLDVRLRQAKRIKTTSKMLSYLLKGELGDLRFYYEANPKFSMTEREAAQKILAELDREWLPLLAEVHVALRRPQCRWPLAYKRGFGASLPQITVSLDAVKTLQLRAACYLATNETSKAAADIADAFKLAQAVESHPFIVDCLTAITERILALAAFWSGIVNHQWRDEELKILQQTFAADGRLEKLKQAFVNERAIILDMDLIKGTLFIPSGMILSEKCFCAGALQNYLDMIDVKQKTVAVQSSELHERRLAELNIFVHPLATAAMPGPTGMIKKIARAEVYCHQAILACALERYRLRHGKLPLTLGDLAPEFIEKIPNQVTVSDPMIYRRVSDSDYVLYSIGWNLRDDGGTISDDTKADRLDWVWASKPELCQRGKVEK
jgi:hypothetical protein